MKKIDDTWTLLVRRTELQCIWQTLQFARATRGTKTQSTLIIEMNDNILSDLMYRCKWVFTESLFLALSKN